MLYNLSKLILLLFGNFMSFSIQQIRERFQYINASEVPDLFALFFDKYQGLNKYESFNKEHITTTLYSYYNLPKLNDAQLQEYQNKITTDAMTLGNELEGVILNNLGLVSNKQSFKKGKISSTPDAFDGEEVIEIKTTREYTDVKKERYLIQLAVQLYTTDKTQGTIHVCLLNDKNVISQSYKISLSTTDAKYQEVVKHLQELEFLIDCKTIDYLPNFECKKDRVIYEILNRDENNQDILTQEECAFLYDYKNGYAKKAKALDEKVKVYLQSNNTQDLILQQYRITNKTTTSTETEESVLKDIAKKEQELEVLKLKLQNKDFKVNVRRSFDINVI